MKSISKSFRNPRLEPASLGRSTRRPSSSRRSGTSLSASTLGMIVVAGASLAIACGGGSQEQPKTADDQDAEMEASDPNWDPKEEDRAAADEVTAADQVRLGATLYGVKCGSCHGEHGKGGEKAPKLIGAGALPSEPPEGAELREATFTSAQDLFDFVSAKMPPKGAKLGPEEAWGIVAYIVQTNGAELSEPLSEETASSAYIVRPEADASEDEDE